jgi:3-deoxy-D-manno-octulosonic-acid transferase
MLWLYRLLFAPVCLVLAPVYLRRMWRRGGYRNRFGDRFGSVGIGPRRPGVKRVWVQAVSVGEMLAIGPLLQGLRADGVEVYLTTTTSTGYRVACDKYASVVAAIGYFPLDWWFFAVRAWRRIAPDLAILTEGERWPEFLHQAHVRGVPVLAVNARVSDRGYRRMMAVRAVVRPLLTGLSRVLAASEHDAERFRALGFAPAEVTVLGNIKLDVVIPPLDAAQRAQLRRELGLPEGPVLLGSSTWPGEEAALVAAWRAARAAGQAVALLLVPRHAERRAEIEALLRQEGLACHFRSRGAATRTVEVAVADTTGELRKLAQLADLVFVGKSLPPHTEGQTPVEAAALGKPLLFGPGMTNFRVIAQELAAAGAASVAADPAALTTAVAALLTDPGRRERQAAAARAWQQANQGAIQRTLAVIREELARRGHV